MTQPIEVALVTVGQGFDTGECDHWDRWGMCLHDWKHPDPRAKAMAHICSVLWCGMALDGTTQGTDRHYQMNHDGLPPLLAMGPAMVTLRKIG